MTVVFTNGVFDVLHVGHKRILEFAKEQGDRLIVAINSDASARRCKGEGRPINTARDRAEMLLAFRCVDEVVVFDDDTPLELIKQIKPDVLVKGPEARSTAIPGADVVVGYGGRIAVPDWDVAHSTTATCRRICERWQA